MPLEPLPPPFPHGKNSPPPKISQPPHPMPKHKCLSSQPSDICLSDIGKIFHTFPTGTFHTRYTPPAIPKVVLDCFSTHPFSWSWTTKSRPNTGKSFPVPHIPTFHWKSGNRLVHWTVDLFHSFKAHPSPQILDMKGWVPIFLMCIYQSNMPIHFHCQTLASKSSPKSSSIPPPPRQQGEPTP